MIMTIKEKKKNPKNRFLKKIFKSGNSLGILIPYSILNDLNLTKNEIVQVYKDKEGNKIIIEKIWVLNLERGYSKWLWMELTYHLTQEK